MEDTKFSKTVRSLAALVMVAILIASIAPFVAGADENDGCGGADEKIGVLVIAHGSPDDSWCTPVRNAIADVGLPYPVELGFLEFVPNETICAAVKRLNCAGVTKIIAVPLFVSSRSSHIQEIEYVLGLRETLSLTDERVVVDGVEMERSIVLEGGRYMISRVPIKVIEVEAEAGADRVMRAMGHLGEEDEDYEELVPVETDAKIIRTAAMDDHPLAGYTLSDRIAELSSDPGNETVVIVSHGTDDEDDLAAWANNMDCLSDETKKILKYWVEPPIRIKDVKYAFILNETLHPDIEVRAVVENASVGSDVIVVPLMIGSGFFTDSYIPHLLENLTYAYNGKALTPHPDVARWIENRVVCALGDERYGVLVVDHGSKGPKRVNVVKELMKGVHLDVPVALAFAEHPPENESIVASIDELVREGVNHVIVVTLFTQPTSDHDAVVEEVYEAMETLEQTRILENSSKHLGIRLTVAGPVDDSPLIADLILDRAREVSEDEEEETLVICRWGDSTYLQHSELYAQSLADQVEEISDFKDVRFGFMGISSPNIKQTVADALHDGPVVVVTTNSLGSSYVDNLVSGKLEGLSYAFNGKGYYGYPEDLEPHPNIARWIEATVSEQMKETIDDTPEGSTTSLTVEITPAISTIVTTTSVDFGRIKAGAASDSRAITVVNTGAGSAAVSAMLLDDRDGFYNESLRLNGVMVGNFSAVVPSDTSNTSEFGYEYGVLANLVVPDWAGGKYDGTIFFVAESES